ncbi:hypothetical protein [Photobacterium leiognathi]|uniref:hypothetical protein n=1 Tax=Photobacterium leiognathi TaxID=553611 RepID=UPI002980C9A4|nr:hypothetical protein [Photobacterium leiognathi]
MKINNKDLESMLLLFQSKYFPELDGCYRLESGIFESDRQWARVRVTEEGQSNLKVKFEVNSLVFESDKQQLNNILGHEFVHVQQHNLASKYSSTSKMRAFYLDEKRSSYSHLNGGKKFHGDSFMKIAESKLKLGLHISIEDKIDRDKYSKFEDNYKVVCIEYMNRLGKKLTDLFYICDGTEINNDKLLLSLNEKYSKLVSVSIKETCSKDVVELRKINKNSSLPKKSRQYSYDAEALKILGLDNKVGVKILESELVPNDCSYNIALGR